MSNGTANKVILIGNVGQTPECRSTPNGTLVANLNLATDDSYKDRKSGQLVSNTDWHRVVFVGGLAEVVQKHVNKGDKLYVVGKQKTRKFSKDGQDRWITEVVVDFNGEMQMLGGRPTSQSGQPQQPSSQQGQGALPDPVDPKDDDYPF